MATKEKFQIQPEKRSAFDRRVAQATGLVALDQARREAASNEERKNMLAKKWDKVDLLDTSKEGKGAAIVAAYMLESITSEKKPMIFTKSTKTAREPLDVAFGNNDMSDRNIIEVVDGAVLDAHDIREIQGAFKDGGVTFVGHPDSFNVSYAEYEQMLGTHDAVAVFPKAPVQAEHQEQHRPQDSVAA